MKLTVASGTKADGRRRTIVDVFRTLAWYETVVHCTPYDSPARLEKAFHHDGEGRKRLWERYAKLGKPTPSVTIKGRPGLVAMVGSRYLYKHLAGNLKLVYGGRVGSNDLVDRGQVGLVDARATEEDDDVCRWC